MRTWSVSGTAFALWTRSSSLSMSTRTSICRMLLLVGQWGPAPSVRESLPQTARDGFGHELFDISAEGGDLLHAARRDEADLRARHHVDGLDVGCERAVELVHLELPLEVGDHAQPLDDDLRVPASREVDDELTEDVDFDVVEVGDRVAEELQAFLDAEHGLLVLRRADDSGDDAVEDSGGARDHVDVPVRDGVVRAGADGRDHRSNSVRRAAPYLRLVRVSRPGTSGWSRAPVSYTSSPSGATTRTRCGARRSRCA